MKHETLFGFALEALEALHVIAGAESGGDQRLRFAASEDGAAVRTGQDACLNPDVADLIESATVGTALVVDDLVAENPLAESFVVFFELRLRFFIVGRKCRD